MDHRLVGLLVAGAVIAVSGVILQHRTTRRKVERLLESRTALEAAAFGRAYFGDSEGQAALAAHVRDILARHVPFPLEGLLPDDDFLQDLRIDDLNSMATLEFIQDLEEGFGIQIPDEDVGRILTFRQLINYLRPRVSIGQKQTENEQGDERWELRNTGRPG